MEWSLGEAKAKFSTIIAKVATEGAQVVTKFGAPAAVVVSPQEYQSLKMAQRNMLLEFAGCLTPDEADDMLNVIQASRVDKEMLPDSPL